MVQLTRMTRMSYGRSRAAALPRQGEEGRPVERLVRIRNAMYGDNRVVVATLQTNLKMHHNTKPSIVIWPFVLLL